jgi:hypothetical protein
MARRTVLEGQAKGGRDTVLQSQSDDWHVQTNHPRGSQSSRCCPC